MRAPILRTSWDLGAELVVDPQHHAVAAARIGAAVDGPLFARRAG